MAQECGCVESIDCIAEEPHAIFEQTSVSVTLGELSPPLFCEQLGLSTCMTMQQWLPQHMYTELALMHIELCIWHACDWDSQSAGSCFPMLVWVRFAPINFWCVLSDYLSVPNADNYPTRPVLHVFSCVLWMHYSQCEWCMNCNIVTTGHDVGYTV